MRKEAHTLWTVLVVLFTLAGLGLLILFNAGFDLARAAADLLAKDGSADPFTPDLYHSLRLPLSLAGAFLLAAAGAMLAWRARSRALVTSIALSLAAFLRRLSADTRRFFSDLRGLRFSRGEGWLLAALILLAVVARVLFVMQPFKHDEAYTVAVFANQPLRDALSDYHLPNNHLFHTLLVHIVYSVFGYAQWAVRLPSLLAGVLSIPALYLLARRLHGRTTAVIAAASAAAVPVMIEFATQSRGYTLVILFTLLLFLLAIYIRRRPNLFAWALVVVCGTLGIYTVPVFYFPYGSFLLWMALTFLVNDIDARAYGSRWRFVLWTGVSGLVTLLLTVLLYTPPALRSGLNAVLPYQVSDPLTYHLFLQEADVRLTEFVRLAMMELPAFLLWVILAGFVLSLVFPPRTESDPPAARVRVPLQVAVVVGTFAIIFALRAPPWARFLTFLVPLALMWAAAGWVGLLQRIQRPLPGAVRLDQFLAGVVLVAALVGTGARFAHPLAGFDVVGTEEQVTRYLIDNLRQQDFIVVDHPQDAAVWYYWRLHGQDPVYFRRDRPFDRVLALVVSADEQTLNSVLSNRGPDAGVLDLNAAEVIFQLGSARLYQIPTR